MQKFRSSDITTTYNHCTITIEHNEMNSDYCLNSCNS